MKFCVVRVLVVVFAISPGAYAQNLRPIIGIDDQTKDKTADAKINRCIAELPAHWGICDARGFGPMAQNIAATIKVGTSEKIVTLVVDRATEFEWTITNGEACVFSWVVGQQSSLAGRQNLDNLTAGRTTNVDNKVKRTGSPEFLR